MSKHHHDRTVTDVRCGRIAERVTALVDPWTETVSQWVQPAPGQPLVPRVTNVEQPCLLDQLAQPERGSTAGVSSSTAGSRPPTNLEPLSVLADIEHEVRRLLERVDPRWSHDGVIAALRHLAGHADQRSTDQLRQAVAGLHARFNATTADRLRALMRHAPALDEDTLREVDRQVSRWWIRARIATTWADPPMRPHVPCSECSAVGKIRVQLYPTVATCLECAAVWDSTTIDALGDHVQLMAEHAAAERVARVIDTPVCATCGHRHDPGHYPTDEILEAHRATVPAELRGRTAADVLPQARGVA
jgi:hypothetical protein